VPKFLSQDESKEWLRSFAVRINQNRALVFPHDAQRETQTLIAQLPEKSQKLTYFLERVVDWLPRGGERFLWLSDWTTYPPHPLAFFETVRFGCGESRHIIEAPGCLFESDSGSANQEFSDVPDTSTLIGFSLLAVNFNWQAYLVTRHEMSHVYLGDEFISFFTTDDRKLDEAFALARRFELRIKQRK
jgi:hypothetical protein